MTGPAVVNIYYQAYFLVLFWVHECNAVSWHGNTRIGDMSGGVEYGHQRLMFENFNAQG